MTAWFLKCLVYVDWLLSYRITIGSDDIYRLSLRCLCLYFVIFCKFAGLERALQGVADAFRAVEAVHGWNKELIPDRSTFDDALYAQTVIDSIKQSSKIKQWVAINVLDEEPDPNPHLSSVVRRSALTSFY